MKISISLPDSLAQEIKAVAEKNERNVSWYLQKAWLIARPHFLLAGKRRVVHEKRKAMAILDSLKGCLKADYPHVDSVTLAHTAFSKK